MDLYPPPTWKLSPVVPYFQLLVRVTPVRLQCCHPIISNLLQYRYHSEPRNDTFANHIATVSDYMQRVSKSSAPEALRLLETLSKYIVASSAPKLSRRIQTPIGRGIIAGFVASEREVQRAYDGFGDKIIRVSRMDKSLTDTLLTIPDDLLETMMKHHPIPSASVASLTKLKSALPVLGSMAYNKETCAEFHHLVTAILIGYRSSVIAFVDGKKSGVSVDKLEPLAITLWQFANVLWRIAHSKMLTYHLDVLRQAAALPVILQVRGAKEEDDKGIVSNTMPERSSLYLRGFLIQVSHYNALEVLKTCCKNKPLQEVKLNLVAVRSPDAPHSRTRTFALMKDTLRRISEAEPSTITPAEHWQAAECHARVGEVYRRALVANDEAFVLHQEAAQHRTPSSTVLAQEATVHADHADSLAKSLFNADSAYEHMETLLAKTGALKPKRNLLQMAFKMIAYKAGNFHCESLLLGLPEASRAGEVPENLRVLIEVLSNKLSTRYTAYADLIFTDFGLEHSCYIETLLSSLLGAHGYL
jgi:hypothetical protein